MSINRTSGSWLEVQRVFYERYVAWLGEAKNLHLYCMNHGVQIPPFLERMINGDPKEPSGTVDKEGGTSP